ncbi:MAG: EAL domain-containing protein [Solirubrobacteraceae bacterium]|nr:EAL domain-containing protein [Solirubrobacteraceae bacterium]
MTTPLRLLVIEDSPLDAELVQLELVRHGFDVDARRVDTGHALAEALAQGGWDIAVCDHSIPSFGSGDALAIVREQAPELPIVILSGTIGEEAAVQALKDGARDVVVKTNIARIGAVVDRELEEQRIRRERAVAEQALRDSEARKSAMLDSALDGIVTVDHGGRIVDFNAAAQEMFGLSLELAVGRPLEKLVPPDLQEAFRAGLAHELESPDGGIAGSRIEASAMRSDGSVFPAEVSITRTDLGGRPFFTGYVRDISDRVRRERVLREDAEALAWVRRIRDALSRDRFVLHAQPIVSLSTGDVVQNELLIRLDEDGTIIPPGDFLPVAERYGLVTQIDRWVIAEAAELVAGGMRVQVNVSAESMGDPGLFAYLQHVLLSAGADPAHLVLELTETALMKDEATAGSFVTRAVELGCGVALDDFGTGYGAFTYLKRLPVSALKIDIEFVRDLAEHEASRAVVSAVVQLAQNLGRRTIAEGVEDEATVTALRELGVDDAQGFHFGRPAPIPRRG